MAARRKLGWLTPTVLALAVMIPLSAIAVTDADRMAVYREFRAQYDAKKYADAQPLAERLVQLTEAQYGSEELPLTNPLTNLATVHYKLGHYAAAIENYQRTLRILQAKSTIADKQQIRPLHGLGVSFMGANDPESAVVALKRAADLSRNTDGLFNINQIEFIDALIDAYEASGRYPEAEKESLYAMRVEEAAYGRSSIKLLDRLDKLARWYEAARRYTTERNVYERALGILAKSAPENDLRRIPPLRGIARSFRLEAFYGVEGGDTSATFNSGNAGTPVFSDGTQQRRGETSLNTALSIIDANQPPNEQLRGEVLIDLGDWFLVSNAMRRAYDCYADAWKALASVSNTRILESPRILAYRPSISSVDRSQLDPAEAVIKTVRLQFKVDRDGRIDDVTSPTTDVPENIVRNSAASMKRSRYAPRIENGLPVPTDNVVFIERVLIKVSSPDTETPSGKAEQKAAEQEPAPSTVEPQAGAKEPAPSPPPPSR
jgi:tetratricopeptide (TPR) repeat protein